MIMKAQRFRSIGWLVLLALCVVAVMVLAFRVNALRSQVMRTEGKIVAMRMEELYLRTEFETRANQQQLRDWNAMEFGYVAPSAGQYLENERQLAQLARPDSPGAPEPLRVASLDDAVVAQAAFPAFVSPLSGKPMAEEAPAGQAAADFSTSADHDAAKAALGANLSKVRALSDDQDADALQAAKPTPKAKSGPAAAKSADILEKRKALAALQLGAAAPKPAKQTSTISEARSRK